MNRFLLKSIASREFYYTCHFGVMVVVASEKAEFGFGQGILKLMSEALYWRVAKVTSSMLGAWLLA